MTPRYSIGVPTYNQAAYIGATLDSLLAQRPLPFEIVVSENHSTDDTAERLAAYGTRIRVVRPPRHLTMMENWNFLCGELRGDWFTLLSSDDVALPGYVAAMTRAAARYPQAVLVRAGYAEMNANGEVQRRKRLHCGREVGFPANFTEQLRGPRVNFSAYAVQRAAFERAGGFPAELRLFGDWGLWLRLCCYGSFVRADEVVGAYRGGDDYRRGIAAERFQLRLNDDRFIYQQIMPATAARTGLPLVQERLHDAAHARLYARLYDLDDKVSDLDRRAALLDSIADWYGAYPDLVALAERLRTGAALPPRVTGPRWKRVLRPLVVRLLDYWRS